MGQLGVRHGELTIGELAERSGTPVTTLRFYEDRALLRSTRTPGNQRRYSREALRRVALIRLAHCAGIPLAEIREVLDQLPADRSASRRDWRNLAKHWQERLNARIQWLEQLRDEFTDCIGCGCLSLGPCAMSNPNDELGQRGAGPRRLLDPDCRGGPACSPAEPTS
ncbi:MerR family redox-sensitive transcriptional activator SoxR [Tamaricihabitans halophyticus]|uniref:MerR family redox-sensitive transcriptional activator SoxR n=1 Tax=Tamaricihabitans halophyticus TaxID=1262583 RepID=A0A4R2R547_9PSEU|nr:redox-sensitive transcriptional activator SoxR [Tamaricihabitans halophyticus]TCP56919.1 MerR family redox-sensitive transcriptional activator SoxR [Tamaricihabitans halophyticus]